MEMLGFTFCIFVLSSLLFSCSSIRQTCTGREIFTNTSGTIRVGIKNKYSNYSRCEWLIDAGSSEKSILLEFSSMETECSYDFVMIYDGNSFNSTTLATYSGNTLPKPVLATSGYMLVYLFSDRNYNLEGFVANYTIQECPYSCNRNGTCVKHVCLCDKGFIGEFCEKQLCPDSCNSHGQCHQNGCHCDEGYMGDDCSLPIDRLEGDVRWYSLSKSSQNFTARFGHTSAFIKSVNCIYAYGGFSLYRILDDVVRYCLNSSMWEIAIKSNPWPSGRKNHASVTVDDGFYILGGVLDNGSYSNDLWFYDISSENWTRKATNSSLQLEKLMDHTLTYANGWLYVIGGKKEDGLFSSDIFRINETECESWKKLKMSGDRRLSRMVSGHTAVFHSVSNTILVYGGYRSKYSKYVVLSGYVYAFNLQYNVWSVIKNPQIVEEPTYKQQENHIPNKRAHHTSVIMGNYMVVYGGNIHIHQDLETCYDNEIFLYHLGCHQWVKHPLFMITDTHGKRRFGHSSISAFGNIMFVIGGYRGSVLGDVTAFKFPPTVAPAETELQEDTDYCKQYTDVHKCIDDIECVLCTARKDTTRTGCVHRTRKRECDSNKKQILVDTPCQGICSSLLSCQSCLSHGQGINLRPSSPSNRVYQEECSWCIKSSSCTQTVDPEELCLPGEEFSSGLDGWWGATNPSWNSIDQCTNNEIPAGIQVMYYYQPDNILQPDQVLFMKSFDMLIEEILPYHGNIDETGKLITVRITGYIYPLDAPLVYGSKILQLYLAGTGDIVATLNLSNDSSVKNQEIVIPKSTYKITSTTNLANRNSVKLFPNTTRGHKYYVAVEAERHKKDAKAALSLQWNIEVSEEGEMRGTHHHMQNLHPITMEFLEPYNSVHCSIHNNCLACMTDASCAWCSSSSTCLYKGNNSTNCNRTYAVTHPAQCDLCHDYPDCYACVSDDLCEWSTKYEKCIRRGRYMRNLRQISECPQPCYLRKNCNSCVVKDKDECFWCENTGECFPFAHYISHHMSGQCQEWVDSDDLLHNHTCRDCSVYKSCDNCLSRYGCGWCGNVDNRMIGKCVDGDFSGPAYNLNCSVIVADLGKEKNITVDDPAMWMYDKCLDVDECAHDVYNCDENASCVNTETSYTCVCNKGFIQYGNQCKKTCYYDCLYGKCSADYECHCDLGYTGLDCSTDCQCNNQSICTKGVGKCDSCQNNTNGSHCQFCLHGYYGIPSKGCKACHCNGHAETSRGQCSYVTGECFCTHNTEGEHCERCQEGYYGDPRNGGKCFRNCDNRVILNQKSGSLGSFHGTGVTSTRKHCVWIISELDIDKVEIEEPIYDTSEISITFTIDNIVTECGREHVYVYEGIPSFIYGHNSPDTDTGLLASFCGSETPKSVTVRSKVITVFFETGVYNHPIWMLTADILTFAGSTAWHKELIVPGFNASYQVNDCGLSCRYQLRLQNPVCQGNKCICDAGFEGDECRKFVCSPGCLFNQDSQSCHCNSSLGPVEIFPWYTVFQPYTRLPEDISRSRYGHTLVACGSDSMYMFGGYSLRHGLLNDVWMFNLTTNKWTQIVPFTTTEPTGRYYHTAVYLDYLKTMYVFGGFVRRGNNVEATNEMWKFAIGAHKWTLEVSSEVYPVAGHTMTKIGDAKLLVIGGFSRTSYFSENMYEYDATISTWRVYTHRDLIGAPIGLYGHTAVHHEETQSIYIYGGILYRSPRVNLSESPRVVLSDELYAFDLVSKRWNNLQSTKSSEEEWKDKRIFHTAVDVGKYMVIFGGQSDDQQLSDKVLIYHYLCNDWHSFQFKEVQEDAPISIRVSAASVAIETSVYIMGGYSGEVHSGMIKVTLPIDRCRLIKDEHECVRSSTGCKACIISSPDGSNVTSCYSAHIHKFLPYECFGQTLLQGKGECDKNWHLRRDCDGYTTCDSCLAVFPYFKDIRQICKWCSNCGENKCVKVGRKCTGQTCINHLSSSPVGESHWCGIFECGTSTCERCKALKCEWTSTKGYNEEENWYCRRNVSPNITVCPAPCQSNANCQSCIRSVGAEAGSGKCVWSHALQECMSEAYKPLRCSHGNCGLLIDSSTTECLRPCHEFRQCSNCLRAPGCGWCAGNNGMGLCMPGGMKGPTGGVCNPGDIRNFQSDSPMNQYHWSIVEPIWSYISCPPENECINGHHTCNNITQDCFDTLKGFNCSCKKGYREDSNTKECIPVCHQGCQHGVCVRPDKCDCSFGFVGQNCTVECECHKYSECESVEKTKHCLLCHNNTQGAQCEHCKLWFVGSPKLNQPCKSCFSVCNNHTNRCSSVKDFKKLNASTIYSTYDYHRVIRDFNPNGPISDPVCIRCQNNTEGRKCDGCQSGYFRHKGMTKFDACIKCQCHGHSHFCDNMTGECRPCRNNTRTRCSSDENDSPDTCWKKQCAVCEEYFQGHPVHDHQCYRQMNVDREYCLDPETQNECSQNTHPLMQGRSVFFAVQPRYLNVDIRITIDVLKGGADVFFSSSDQTFTVKDNKENGVHILELDSDLHIRGGSSQRWSYPVNKRSLDNYNIHIHNIMTNLAESKPLDKRSVQNSTSGVTHELLEIHAKKFHTYHTVTQTNTILRVKNVESRLVITLPVHSHNLKFARFYIIMYGVGSKYSNNTFGNLYFRQDQPHIDLFVFFSVFFSSFFLFLAVCVLLWKMKQAVDTQRSRQQRAKEMMHMASRPFSKVLVYIEPEPIIMSSTPVLRRPKLPKIPHRNVPIMGLTPVDLLPPIIHTTMTVKEKVPFDVIPIAVEPIISGSAAIRTVVIQLPGGPHATSKLCIGSTLTSNYRPANNNPKGNTRRRPSSTQC